MSVDLVIRNGTIVTPGMRQRADIGIQSERIVQIGGPMDGVREIDASGLHALPGAIDAHVHLTPAEPAPDGIQWADDFTSGSEAALAGGITTVGNMTFLRPGELMLDGLGREAELVRAQAIADVILHPVISDPRPEIIEEIRTLEAAGHTDIKFFMSTPTFDAHATGFLAATRAAGGLGLLTMIHCEDYPIIRESIDRLLADGRGALRHYPASRPIVSEVVATQRAVALCEQTGAPIYVVHLSCARALQVCAEAQALGLPVYVETRPLYLHLTSERFEEPEGAKYVGQPPLREESDRLALWHGLASGSIHTVCTDHAPWTLEHKLDPALNVGKLRPGVENLQTMLPMLCSEGVRAGLISLERLVELTATNVAKLFGLYPRKGTIAVGADADLVLWDLDETRTIRGEDMLSRAGHSIYEGREVTGWPRVTIRRGEVVYENGRITAAPGSGRLIPREQTRGV
ncbi:MAG TPA: amidohydrolase family protein [Thermomicrobiales bacterium]|nr:amidohydrolase family protein [Thermomicrobiales bacterium]